jgi:hypothetical protein
MNVASRVNVINCLAVAQSGAVPDTGQAEQPRSTLRVVWLVALALPATLLLGGCANSPASTPSAKADSGKPSHVPTPDRPPQAAIRIPRADYASPASVAASFFVAWATVDSVHDGPETELMRCASLVTPALESQLSTYEVSPYEWQVMREDRMVSTVHVQTVTHPVAAPAPTRTRVYLSIYAERVTVSTSGRRVTSAGISVEMIRDGKRWLVASILYY